MVVKDNDGIWELVDKKGKSIDSGAIVTDFRGEKWRLVGGQPPMHSGSSGRVSVRSRNGSGMDQEYFPTVFDLQWIKRSRKK